MRGFDPRRIREGRRCDTVGEQRLAAPAAYLIAWKARVLAVVPRGRECLSAMAHVMTQPLDDPDLQLLYEYWRAKRHGRAMPSRADIDPVELPGRLWPALVLLDVVRDGERIRFRYRRVGTQVSEAIGREVTHQFIDEALPARDGYRDYVVGIYRELIAVKKPLYTENLFALEGQLTSRLTKRLSLPLSSDGKTVDMALVALVYEHEKWSLPDYFAQSSGFREITRRVLDDDAA